MKQYDHDVSVYLAKIGTRYRLRLRDTPSIDLIFHLSQCSPPLPLHFSSM